MAGKANRGIIPVFAGLAAKTARRPLGRCVVAKGIWRAQRDSHAAGHFLGRDGASGSATHGEFAWPRTDRTDDYLLRNGRPEETVYSQNPQRGRDMVSGFFRTKRWVRSCQPAN